MDDAGISFGGENDRTEAEQIALMSARLSMWFFGNAKFVADLPALKAIIPIWALNYNTST